MSVRTVVETRYSQEPHARDVGHADTGVVVHKVEDFDFRLVELHGVERLFHEPPRGREEVVHRGREHMSFFRGEGWKVPVGAVHVLVRACFSIEVVVVDGMGSGGSGRLQSCCRKSQVLF